MKLKSPEKYISPIRRIYLYKYYSYVNALLKLPLDAENTYNWDGTDFNYEKGFDIITVSFNNTHVLKHQIIKLKENLTDKNFNHIIADNSSLAEKREEIKSLCREYNLIYVGIPKPKSRFDMGGSKSHAAALNWIYYHIITKRNPRRFGFLDHDIYPLQPVSIEDKMQNQPIYGKKSVRKEYWYLWPGFAFFETIILKNMQVNFSPAKVNNTYLDTGGTMWYPLFSKLDASGYVFTDDRTISLKEMGYNYLEEVEFLDDIWFHSINASFWNKQSADYSEAIDDIILNNKIYRNTK
ncbi:MAG TPA: hypothetical protein DIT04_11615 [Dysgonomonas sp.]|nr:hypothetical protein [Dysgonomonas sp.]